MSWGGIARYLNKFKIIDVPEKATRRHFIDCVEKKTGVRLKEKDIKIGNSIIHTNIEPFLKTEIFLKKDDILKDLGILVGSSVITDIR